MKLAIEVTEDHIQRGLSGSPQRCPIALAIKEAAGHAAGVSVGCQSVSIRLYRRHRKYYLPENAIQFVEVFDNSGTGQPFVLELDSENMEETEI